MPADLLFDFAAVHINGKAAEGVDLRINLNFVAPGSQSGEPWHMWVRHGVLNARPGQADDAQLTVTGPKAALVALLLDPGHAAETIAKHSLPTDGDVSVLEILAGVTDTFDPQFNIVIP
ncbi:hypothetical protein G6045_00265 [Streptomyces sp. YC504]|uniref:Alkyl sulfatase C-terminal domain-containing protein n=2 Tax=Streptomyces mesophilus TaxID=1775132 RepID=A0A6G4X9S0_9ACTN|nr:hypothetical protein [Streptomyces mesophilus]